VTDDSVTLTIDGESIAPDSASHFSEKKAASLTDQKLAPSQLYEPLDARPVCRTPKARIARKQL
jgi:hypothetical protein